MVGLCLSLVLLLLERLLRKDEQLVDVSLTPSNKTSSKYEPHVSAMVGLCLVWPQGRLLVGLSCELDLRQCVASGKSDDGGVVVVVVVIVGLIAVVLYSRWSSSRGK